MTILGILYLKNGDSLKAFEYLGEALSLDP